MAKEVPLSVFEACLRRFKNDAQGIREVDKKSGIYIGALATSTYIDLLKPNGVGRHVCMRRKNDLPPVFVSYSIIQFGENEGSPKLVTLDCNVKSEYIRMLVNPYYSLLMDCLEIYNRRRSKIRKLAFGQTVGVFSQIGVLLRSHEDNNLILESELPEYEKKSKQLL